MLVWLSFDIIKKDAWIFWLADTWNWIPAKWHHLAQFQCRSWDEAHNWAVKKSQSIKAARVEWACGRVAHSGGSGGIVLHCKPSFLPEYHLWDPPLHTLAKPQQPCIHGWVGPEWVSGGMTISSSILLLHHKPHSCRVLPHHRLVQPCKAETACKGQDLVVPWLSGTREVVGRSRLREQAFGGGGRWICMGHCLRDRNGADFAKLKHL